MPAASFDAPARPTLWLLAGCLALLPLTLAVSLIHLARLAVRLLFISLRSLLRYRSYYASQSPVVLVTGASTPEGLDTCRWLYESGHTVIAADHEQVPYTSWLRASCAVRAFYALTDGDASNRTTSDDVSPAGLLAADVVRIVGLEKLAVWIPCGGRADARVVAAAKAKVERETHCRVLGPDVDTFKKLRDEAQFSSFVRSLDAGLSAPEIRTITSRAEVHKALGSWPMKRRFVLERQDAIAPERVPTIRSSSTHRPRVSSVNSFASTLTLSSDVDADIDAEIVKEYEALDALILPSSSLNDTYDRIASIKISRTEPWLLQELVSGPQFAAHCLIVHNHLEGFAVSLLSSQRIAKVLPDRTALVRRLESFMQTFAEGLPHGTSTQVNTTFILREEPAVDGVKQILCPISADFSAAAPDLLYGAERDHKIAFIMQRVAMSEESAYEEVDSIHQSSSRRRTSGARFEIHPEVAYYSFPTLLFNLLLYPLLDFIVRRASLEDVLDAWKELAHRVVYDKEELFSWKDSWPWFWYWLVTAPMEVFDQLWH